MFMARYKIAPESNPAHIETPMELHAAGGGRRDRQDRLRPLHVDAI